MERPAEKSPLRIDDQQLFGRPIPWRTLTVVLAVALVLALELLLDAITHRTGSETLSYYGQTLIHVLVTIGVVLLLGPLERNSTKRAVQETFMALIKDEFPLGIKTTEIGLKAIYPSREAATAEISKAFAEDKLIRKRLLFLGVAFSEYFTIEQKLDRIRRILQEAPKNSENRPKIDVRFLILNPHTSPAVFRSFFESDPSHVREFLDTDGAAFVLRSKLFKDCREAFDALKFVPDHVRFYRRDPTVWMVAVDDRVFVQSYTFGRPENRREDITNLRLGGHMPVFEYDASKSRVWEIIEDHFNRIWNSSDDTYDKMQKQYAISEQILKDEVFAYRRTWLESVARYLGA